MKKSMKKSICMFLAVMALVLSVCAATQVAGPGAVLAATEETATPNSDCGGPSGQPTLLYS